ncbi:MAG: ParB/RepB/Spo0J family partition protein [Clostridia bacterium]|nr:ParB/RepB/Spo0J family partition protein [Clostridia bacterium]
MFKFQSAPSPSPRALSRVPVRCIHPNSAQPRRSFHPESIAELAESIRLHGLLSPLLVRAEDNGHYALIAGERRLRALKLLNRQWAEVIVLTGSDCDCALIALVENLQREDLHYLDVAAACRRILDEQPITQERLAASLSCSPSALANRLRLLKLSTRVRASLRESGLTERHARALLRLKDEAAQLALISQTAEKRLSVKQLEALVEQQASRPARPHPRPSPIVRDNRIVINALLDTVRQLKGIGVPVKSRIEESADYVDVIVTIPAVKKAEH